MIARFVCWFRGHDLFEMKTAVMCRRCFQWWRKYDQVEVVK
jgi:hypothetical protein